MVPSQAPAGPRRRVALASGFWNAPNRSWPDTTTVTLATSANVPRNVLGENLSPADCGPPLPPPTAICSVVVGYCAVLPPEPPPEPPAPHAVMKVKLAKSTNQPNRLNACIGTS